MKTTLPGPERHLKGTLRAPEGHHRGTIGAPSGSLRGNGGNIYRNHLEKKVFERRPP
jgi:hypothetical protein